MRIRQTRGTNRGLTAVEVVVAVVVIAIVVGAGMWYVKRQMARAATQELPAAIHRQDVARVEELLRMGADVRATSTVPVKFYWHRAGSRLYAVGTSLRGSRAYYLAAEVPCDALGIAVFRRSRAIVDLLLEYGAPLDGIWQSEPLSPSRPVPPILLASDNGEMFDYLVALGADPSPRPGGNQPLTSSVVLEVREPAECLYAWLENQTGNTPGLLHTTSVDDEVDYERLELYVDVRPWSLSGNLAEGDQDVTAILIREKATGKRGIVIVHERDHSVHVLGAGNEFGQGGDNFSWLTAWRVEEWQPASVNPADRKTDREVLYVETPPGSSGAMIWWNGTEYEWTPWEN